MKGFINKHSPIEPICTVRMHCILTVLFSSPDRCTQPGGQINTASILFSEQSMRWISFSDAGFPV